MLELLNPLMLWGALAISIPIVIHFWHQKKGKIIAWAATSWLIEKNLQQARGLRLDNWVLLLLRCILLLILAFYLAKPLVSFWQKSDTPAKIHLVQPNALIVDNFKFEIENALKKKEKCYWLNASLEPIQAISTLPTQQDFDANILQSSLNKVSNVIDNEEVELYFVNSSALAKLPHIYVPTHFELHSLTDSTQKNKNAVLALADGKKVLVDANNQLKVSTETLDNAPIAHTGALKVLLLNTNTVEKQSIKAALNALTNVYQIAFDITEQNMPNTLYDMVFADKTIANPSKNTWYIYTDTDHQRPLPEHHDVLAIPTKLLPQTSEMVFNGQLPEYLGEKIIEHFGLQNTSNSLSHQQLNTLFKTQTYPKKAINSGFPKVLLLVFILLLSLERWIAIYKNT